MKRASIIFLQAIIILIGIGAFAFILWEPHLEGRNASATLLEIYFNDPFLAYAYTASVAFFTALYQAFKLLKYIEQDKLFTPNSVKALRTIKYCALSLVVFILAPLAYLIIARPEDDIAGGVAMGLILIITSAVIAAIANILEKVLKDTVNTKLEKDLTV